MLPIFQANAYFIWRQFDFNLSFLSDIHICFFLLYWARRTSFMLALPVPQNFVTISPEAENIVEEAHGVGEDLDVDVARVLQEQCSRARVREPERLTGGVDLDEVLQDRVDKRHSSLGLKRLVADQVRLHPHPVVDQAVREPRIGFFIPELRCFASARYLRTSSIAWR